MKTSLERFNKIITKSPYFWFEYSYKKIEFIKVLDTTDTHGYIRAYVFNGSHHGKMSEAYKNNITTISMQMFLDYTKGKSKKFSQLSRDFGETIEDDYLHQKDYDYFFYEKVPYKVDETIREFPFEGDYSELPIYKRIVAANLVSGEQKTVEREDFNKIVPTTDKEEILISIASAFSRKCLSILNIKPYYFNMQKNY